MSRTLVMRTMFLLCAGTACAVWATLSAGPLRADAPASETLRVTYVTLEAVYINAGKLAGLAPGDTLTVAQGERAGVRLVVATVSSHSAACRIVGQGAVVEVDDVLVPLHPREIAPSTTQTAVPGPVPPREAPSPPGERPPGKNRFHGFIDLDYRLLHDFGDTGVSWQQPGFSGRIVVDNVAGTGLSFRFRETSRWSYRDYPADAAAPNHQESVHRLTELAFVYGTPDSPVEIAVGRTLSSRIRGLGYIDGGYVSYGIGARYRVGVAGGTEPDPENSSFSTENARAAVFFSVDAGSYETQRLASTVAFSGSYHSGTVSREFVYLQNAYSYARRFTAYQSLEVDVNRDWRREAAGSSLTFSNFYLITNIVVNPRASIDLSFDARENVRDYTTINTPDSLFDGKVYSGFRGGLSFALQKDTRLRGSGGVQFGENDQKTQYASLMVSARHFIRSTDNLSARLSWSDAPSTRTYSPAVTYRAQLARQTQVLLGGGGYLQSTRGVDDNNYYFELGADQWLGSRYSLSASARRYFGGSLESIEVMAKAGVSF